MADQASPKPLSASHQSGKDRQTSRIPQASQNPQSGIAKQLAQLSVQLLSAAEQLRVLAGAPQDPRDQANDAAANSGEAPGSYPGRDVHLAREIYSLRRQRSSIFQDSELFGEPAWDILLDLYIAAIDRKAISVSSACIGSGAPPTTGLRWLGILEKKGLVERSHDPKDQRRIRVHLSAKGIAAMDRFFAQTRKSGRV